MHQSLTVERRATGAAQLDGVVDISRDRDLVERCQGGDQSSFAELYDRYHRRLLRFCLRRLHQPNDAEEAVQEAFTRAWRALPRFGGERRFYPWLTVIAGNVCTDILRRRSRLVPMEELPLTVNDYGEDVDAALLRQVDLTMATEALSHLSERHQRVLRLRESSGWSTQRIAEQEGVAVPAVDTLLWRARQALKREFVALAEASGKLGAAAGCSLLALRRFGARHALQAASRLPVPASLTSGRGPGAIVASVALAGAAIAGGGVALVTSGSGHARPNPPAATSARVRPVPSSAGGGAVNGGAAGGQHPAMPVSPPTSGGGSIASAAGASPGAGQSGTTGASGTGSAGSTGSGGSGSPLAGAPGLPTPAPQATGIVTALAGIVGSGSGLTGGLSPVLGSGSSSSAPTAGATSLLSGAGADLVPGAVAGGTSPLVQGLASALGGLLPGVPGSGSATTGSGPATSGTPAG
ncbi:MAG: RNA polymerase sigma factor [Acidimicrobiales bacterium]